MSTSILQWRRLGPGRYESGRYSIVQIDSWLLRYRNPLMAPSIERLGEYRKMSEAKATAEKHAQDCSEFWL